MDFHGSSKKHTHINIFPKLQKNTNFIMCFVCPVSDQLLKSQTSPRT